MAKFSCAKMKPMEAYFYLAPKAKQLETCSVAEMPTLPTGCVRVVCVSDTHNEHACLRLPEGHLLLHTGDVLTESGLRHVERDAATRQIIRVTPAGEALFVNFAEWFGALRYEHKVLVAGNHDMVLQGLGKDRVQEILDANTTHGKSVYLEDDTVSCGELSIYGSPYAHYSSHNNAFKVENPVYNISPRVNIVCTHMPAVLPSRKRGGHSEHQEITRPMAETGASLHVGGHCHWANGLYFTSAGIPCVVASVCDSQWLNARALASSDGFRGDPSDQKYGGYNLIQPGFIVDLPCAEARKPASSLVAASSSPPCAPTRARSSIPRSSPRARQLRLKEGYADALDESKLKPHTDSADKPLLILFCPNDPDVVQALLPELEFFCNVHHFEEADAAITAVGKYCYQACVAKLGTKGNLGQDVIGAVRSVHGRSPFVAIHSATAANKPTTRAKLNQEFGIDLFAAHGDEADLIAALYGALVAKGEEHAVLVFAPPNDPSFLPALKPLLPESVTIDAFDQAADCIEAIRKRSYVACFAKLGDTEGNLGVDVIAALRGEQGNAPFVALHSATAARKSELRKWLTDELGVNYFSEHGGEAQMIQAAMQGLRMSCSPSKHENCFAM